MEQLTRTIPFPLEKLHCQKKGEKEEFGQFMTPRRIADFMSALFYERNYNTASLLDAGAGTGILTSSFIDRWLNSEFNIAHLKATTFEIDPKMSFSLMANLRRYHTIENLELNIVFSDFIEHSVDNLHSSRSETYTYCILNPPYKKITSSSHYRKLLKTVGIEAVNLYSGFLALCILLLKNGGEVVAIIPRSFCNGLYYHSFRKFILKRTSIQRIHLFGSRDKAFKSDGVLQENVIMHLKRDGYQKDITISTSTDDEFSDLKIFTLPFKKIVHDNDPNQFIHIPTDPIENPIISSKRIKYKLSELGLDICTGPVVDFRAREYLQFLPDSESAPLIYPFHFSNQSFNWPRSNAKKPNAIRVTTATRKMLMPIGNYVVMRRFSSKEERKRIVAHLVLRNYLKSDYLAFENHLNVIHCDHRGLDEDLARGLVLYFNSSYFDDYFRRFSGHTQVNATDIRNMIFPGINDLKRLGHLDKTLNPKSVKQIDNLIKELL